MDRRDRLRERIKTAAIVALLISAVLLASESGLMSGFFGSGSIISGISSLFKESRPAVTSAEQTILAEAARPETIAVFNSGERFAVRYNDDALYELYEKTAVVFAEALGSGGEPELTDEDAWRSALSSPGLFYEYRSDIPLSILCAWLATEPGFPGNYSARQLCLTGNHLYFRSSGGDIYMCPTAVPDDITVSISGMGSLTAVFSFEVGALAECEDGYMLLFPDVTQHNLYRSENPLLHQSARESVMTALGGSVFISSGYMERDGTAVYVANDFTLRIGADGCMVYRNTQRGDGSSGTEAEAIEAVRQLCSQLTSLFPGKASLSFSQIQASGGTYTVRFDYTVGGGIVALNGYDCAAEATVSEGAVKSLRLVVRTFSDEGKTVELLPETLAAAAAGGRFGLVYIESGEALTPEWVGES